MSEVTIAGIKTEVNLNTLVVIVGFLGTFTGLVSLWNGMQYKQQDFEKWIAAHDQLHQAIAADLSQLHKNDEQLIDLSFRIGQIEKSAQLMDDRLSRITESYGNQFTDIRGVLSQITTQLALTNQALQRIEALKNMSPSGMPK
jgi:flagellar capping protein FliD